MPKLEISVKSESNQDEVKSLYQALEVSTETADDEGREACWGQFRAGMAMCIG